MYVDTYVWRLELMSDVFSGLLSYILKQGLSLKPGAC